MSRLLRTRRRRDLAADIVMGSALVGVSVGVILPAVVYVGVGLAGLKVTEVVLDRWVARGDGPIAPHG